MQRKGNKANKFNIIKYVMKYKPVLPKINGFIKQHISILHGDDTFKKKLEITVFTIYFP